MDARVSGGQTFINTISGGIQDISALLPLLGTEQCEDHVASALTNGYLYAAVSPVSLFGSLGIARAGFKAFVSAISIPLPSCFPWPRFEGAKLLANAGFKPQGLNMPLIMLDEERKQYRTENQICSMMEELHIEDSSRISVSSNIGGWNIKMFISTAFFCSLSILPYIYLNLLGSNTLSHFLRWTFPVLRAIGSFLTATMIQLVMQRRLLTLMRKSLILKGLKKTDPELLKIVVNSGSTTHGEPAVNSKSAVDGEASQVLFPTPDQGCLLVEQYVKLELNVLTDNPQTCVPTHPHLSRFCKFMRWAFPRHSSRIHTDTETPNLQSSNPNTTPGRERLENLQKRIKEANGGPLSMLILLFFLFMGVVASVGGYIGCFSVVRSVKGSGFKETSSWLSLEVFLSIVRIIVWGLNPTSDDAPPLKFKFELDKYPPLATCRRDVRSIEKKKDLPLVRAPEFLQSITSYAGLLKQFSDPRLTLYYTLTWRGRNKDKERVLFITIFDHIERTTRVYMETKLSLDTESELSLGNVASNEKTTSSSCFYSADLITVDLEHGVLKTRLGRKIGEKDDPIAMNDTLRTNLRKHYRSILEQVNRAVRYGPVNAVFKNDWTLQFGETSSQVSDNTEQSSGATSEPVYEKRDNVYLQLGELEEKVQELIRIRGEWVTRYMVWSSNDSHRKLNLLKESGALKVGHEWDEVERDVEDILAYERKRMECMLVDEIYGWEKKLKGNLEDINYLDEMEKETAMRRWRAALWERLEEGRQAMLARMASARSTHKNMLVSSINWLQEDVEDRWQSIFIRLNATKPSPQGSVKDQVKHWLPSRPIFKTGQWREWIEGRCIEMERRLHIEEQGAEDRLGYPLKHCQFALPSSFKLMHSDSKWQYIFPSSDVSLLKRNPHVMHINLYDYIDLSDVTQCTSIFWGGSMQPDIQLPPNILSVSAFDDDLIPDIWHKVCEQNRQQLKDTNETTFVFENMFVPASNDHLRAARSGTFTVWFNGPSSGSLTLQVIHSSSDSQSVDITINGVHSSYSVPHTKTFEEIRMHGGSVSDDNLGLIFRRSERNTLTFSFPTYYKLHFIELVDDLGRPYRPGQEEEGSSRGDDGSDDGSEEGSYKQCNLRWSDEGSYGESNSVNDIS